MRSHVSTILPVRREAYEVVTRAFARGITA